MVLSRMRGARVIRKEDPRLITGSATYVDDVRVPGTLHMVFVRSQYPHAKIRGIRTDQASQMPGVVAIYVGGQAGAAGNQNVRVLRDIVAPSEEPAEEVEAPDIREEEEAEHPEEAQEPDQFWMAIETVRSVGIAVAGVVAETEEQARDAAEAIQIDYDPLPAVVDVEAAMKDGAPQLYPQFANNICHHYDHTAGDADAAFKAAPITVKERLINQRVAGVPMEPRGVVAMPDPMINGLTFWTSTQAQFWNRRDVAASLSMPESNVRTIAPQVGGGFGVKIGSYPEDFMLSAVARDLGRPVKWIETRSENLVVTHQGRAQVADIEVAAEKNGKITGYRLNVIQDQGFYPKDVSLSTLTGLMAVGCYDIKNIDVHAIGVLTNTTEIGAYRGAGRPEAAFYIERVIDLVADACKLDPAEVRRVNFIQPNQFPYKTVTGANYDSGDYEKALDKALKNVNYKQLRQEQADARQQGRYIGIGLSSYVEICGFGPFDSAIVRVERSGAVTVYSGILPQGQGQETAFAQIVADDLGVPFDSISVRFGDTASSPQGQGTMGSRGLVV
ncbi:MAG TPA: xanthine dehydrogenase family protein molybdopterin-binding subunit, partial [Thermomicrobiaceae bacterium]|nr:xanthine dehydrogenase family protein molybdopterin-binding subunit [Thermomicrobiaceae bacterium]